MKYRPKKTKYSQRKSKKNPSKLTKQKQVRTTTRQTKASLDNLKIFYRLRESQNLHVDISFKLNQDFSSSFLAFSPQKKHEKIPFVNY